MKKRENIIALSILYALILIGNIIPVIVNREETQITKYSVPAIMLMLIVIINGVLSYFLRHKGNYLVFRKHRPNEFASDKDYTCSEEYLKRFFGMLELYCAAIPFYIPQIFLTTSNIQTLWALFVFIVPQIIFLIQDIGHAANEFKQAENRRKQREEELKEQVRREEQGYWK